MGTIHPPRAARRAARGSSAPTSRWRAALACADGAAAVEFALVMPVLLLIVLGIIAFGSVIALEHSVQQLAAEAARASIAGLSDQERSQLAERSVRGNAASYPFVDLERVAVLARSSTSDPQSFEVVLRYDASESFFFRLGALLPLPPATFERRAAVKRGGY